MFFNTSDLKTEEIFLRLEKTKEAEPERGRAPAYSFDICLPDGTRAGHCSLRLGHSDKLYYSGNIGYGVDEPYRGNRYAAKACALLFRLAKKHGMTHLFITCDPDNAASAGTCQLAGCRHIETADIPQDHDLYAAGKRQVMIWRFDL